MTPSSDDDARRLRGRASLFLIVTLALVGPPTAAQVLGVHSRYARPWVMFSGKGIGAHVGHFTRVDAQGNATRLDHADLLRRELERADGGSIPGWTWHVVDREGLDRLARRVCRRAQREGLLEDAHLELAALEATSRGWAPVEAGGDVCAAMDEKAAAEKKRGKSLGDPAGWDPSALFSGGALP